jgi:hypothetical protein
VTSPIRWEHLEPLAVDLNEVEHASREFDLRFQTLSRLPDQTHLLKGEGP